MSPALLAQVVHHGHHRGVGDRPFLLQVAEDIAHGHWLPPRPDPAHHPGFKITKHWHVAASCQPATTQIVARPIARSRLAAADLPNIY
jgi:hypothetical protein